MHNWKFRNSEIIPNGVELSEVFCHSDFKWNQLWSIYRRLKNCIFVFNFRSSELGKNSKNTDSKPLNKFWMADFETLDLSTLISRKIWVTEKFCDFHTVYVRVGNTVKKASNQRLLQQPRSCFLISQESLEANSVEQG